MASRAAPESGRRPFSGLDSVALHAPDGAAAVVTCHGAHVVSWTPAGDQERLYLSPVSALDGRAPIRGGVPIVFPQFATYGPLPNHGLVRTLAWRVVDISSNALDACATLRSEDSSETRRLWPHRFACELAVTIGRNRLAMQLRIRNSGTDSFDFRAALHTYVRVTDIEAVRLEGLYGTRYRDRTRADNEGVDRDCAMMVRGEVDRIYADAPRHLTLVDGERSIAVDATAFPDVVVWNPWKDKCAALPDMPDDGYQNMLCIEAAAVANLLTLECGDSWVGSQTLTTSN